MKLKLEKDLVIFDIESTGLSTSNDRIVQLAILKIHADGSPDIERCRLINPEIPISEEASKVHGITNEMVKDEPTFKKLANALLGIIGDADLCGFNSARFDIPMLLEEFHRAGLELDMTNRRTVDVWKIFQKMEPRTLKAAYKFYCGKELEGAHDAMNDVRATWEVLEGQLEKYKGVDYQEDGKELEIEPVRGDVQALHDFTNFEGKIYDYSGKIIPNGDGIPVFNFGKYQSQSVVEVITKNPGYYDWFMKAEFTTDTKNALKKIIEEHKNLISNV
jgi:DNA polymerase-3 subunit epsilon